MPGERMDPPRVAPAPLLPGELDRALSELDAGTAYKPALEQLLLDLPLERADRLMQLLKEGRSGWLPVLRARGGPALFLGNSLSGTLVGLARSGFQVTALDPSHERARFAAHRDLALAHGETRFVQAGGDGVRLPFGDADFALVVSEQEPPGDATELERGMAEIHRVCDGELLLVADNRLGYKRSTGRRGEFRIPDPLEYVAGALRPGTQRTLRGYERLVRSAGFAATRAFALYPHRHDFSQVAALRGERPALFIGPMERRNRPKMIGYKLGLFPWLTPSFALVGASEKCAGDMMRMEFVTGELAARLGEPRPEIDQLVATRGNTAVLHTSLSSSPARQSEGDPAGRWTVHLPLSPHQAQQARQHVAATAALRARFPALPVPEPLWEGELGGSYLTCERRLPGLSAAQLRGNQTAMKRVYADVARNLAELVVEPARPVDDELFEELIGAKFDLVLRFVPDADVRSRLEVLREEVRSRLLGRQLPRVFYHADLRAKHVQVTGEGSLIGFLDWGSSARSDLPYFDLLNLIVHDRKQEADLTIGAAWRLAREADGLRPFERAALDDYAERLGLTADVRSVITDILPVLVGAMAEGNWDYSRPRWVQRGFEL